MRVVVIANQKGGAGKTTHSAHMGVAAMQAGAGPVVLIDTDPQAGLKEWWRARPHDELGLMESSVASLHTDLAALRQAGAALVIIDTPPQAGPMIAATIRHADLVLIPVKPSPNDLRAVGATVAMVEDAGKPMVFLVNEATKRARLTGQAAIALSQHGTVSPVIVHKSEEFRDSMTPGRTVLETQPDGGSASEIRDLWVYMNERLNKGMRK